MQMLQAMRRLRRRRGAAMVEYALLVFFIAFAIVGGLLIVPQTYTDICDTVSTAVGGGLCHQPVTAYGYSRDCDTGSASCRKVVEGQPGSEAAAEASCGMAPDAAQQALLVQAGLIVADSAATALASCEGGNGDNPTVTAYGFERDCDNVEATCRSVMRSEAEGIVYGAADAADCASAPSAQQAQLLDSTDLIAAADGLTKEQVLSSCPATGAELTALGWGPVCSFPDATACFRTTAPLNDGHADAAAADFEAVDDSTCSLIEAQSSDRLALLQALSLLPAGPGVTRQSVQDGCSAPVAVYGWDLQCSEMTAECHRFDPDSWEETVVDSSLCEVPPSPYAYDYLWMSGLTPGGLTHDAMLAQCTGTTGYGYRVDCRNPQSASCYSAYSDGGYPTLTQLSSVDLCQQAQSTEAESIAQQGELIPGAAGLTPSTALQICSATDSSIVYGWTGGWCNQWNAPDWDCRGFDGNRNIGFAADLSHCETFQPTAEQQQLLQQAGLTDNATRAAQDAQCGFTPSSSYLYGWSPQCENFRPTFICFNVSPQYASLTGTTSEANCKNFHPTPAQVSTLQTAGALSSAQRESYDFSWCKPPDDLVYGWSIGCEHGELSWQSPPECAGASASDPSQVVYGASDSQCAAAANPSSADIAVLHAAGLWTRAEADAYNYDTCSGEPAHWLQVQGTPICEDASNPQANGPDYVRYDSWTCEDHGVALSAEEAEARCGDSASHAAVDRVSLGTCTRTFDMPYRNNYSPYSHCSGNVLGIAVGKSCYRYTFTGDEADAVTDCSIHPINTPEDIAFARQTCIDSGASCCEWDGAYIGPHRFDMRQMVMTDGAPVPLDEDGSRRYIGDSFYDPAVGFPVYWLPPSGSPNVYCPTYIGTSCP